MVEEWSKYPGDPRRNRRPIRLLLLTPTFHPSIGGGETYALTVSRELVKRGHAVHVVTDWPHGAAVDLPKREVIGGVTVERLTAYRGRMYDESLVVWEQMAFGLGPELLSAVEEFRPNIILSNSLDTAFQAVMIARQFSLPWAATFHEQAPEAEALGPGRLRTVYESLAPDLVLAASHFYACRATDNGYRGAPVVIHHGVSSEKVAVVDAARLAHRERLGLSADTVLYTLLGRLKWRKGIHDLVQAAARLRDRDLFEFRVVVAGSTNSASRAYADRIRSTIAELTLGRTVEVDEHVGVDEVPRLLAAADVVVQPSYEEGLGLAVLEGMATGRAVITTDIPGTREILTVPDIAMVIQPGDIDALTRTMETLALQPTLRNQLGGRAREHVQRWFSLAAMIDATEASLSDLAGSA